MNVDLPQNNKKPSGILNILYLLLVFLCHFPNLTEAQFNGDFSIERHFLDDENFLDWKAYQLPIKWEHEWRFTENGMRFTVGSISMYRFYISKEIRLSKQIGNLFKVFYKQQEESFFTQRPGYQEAEFRFGDNPYVSMIGFPEHAKKLGHMGFAFSYGQQTDPIFFKISQLEMFTEFNKKNANTDKNEDDRFFRKLPIMQDLNMHYQHQDIFFIEVRHWEIEETERHIRQPAQTDLYNGSSSRVNAEWGDSKTKFFGFRIATYNEYRRNRWEYSGAVPSDNQQDLSLESNDFYFSINILGKNFLTLGVLDSMFKNKILSDSPDEQYLCRLGTRQLYGFWEKSRNNWFSWRFSLQAGTVELSKKFLSLDEEPEQHTTQMKAGVGIILQENEQYRFFANSTWDLDLFQRRQWDGGNVQLQFKF